MRSIYTSYKDMWLKTLKFKARATNEEFWWPFFINLLISLCCFYVFRMPALLIGYNAIIAIPFVSLAIRRIHDTNKSGWNVLWLYIPSILLVIYAGSILYYTQTPEIVDMFLQWFTVMVVGYVVFVVYSVYLFTHHTYPQKNHYGEVPSKTIAEPEGDLLEVASGKNIEDTLSFKTKAFLKKAGSSKKKTKKSSDTKQVVDIVQPVDIVEETKEEEVIPSLPVEESPFTQHISPMGPQTSNDEKQALEDLSDKDTVLIIEDNVLEEQPAIIEDTKAIEHSTEDHSDVIVRAQMKPSKQSHKHKVKAIETPVKITIEQSNDTQKVESEPKKEEKADDIVKTITQKRSEIQNSIPTKPIVEELKEEMIAKAQKKTVHRPIKRKVIQPIQIPDMNVETIRTHSLDSIAKLVEQNMSKSTKEGPMVVATVKKRPVKRKKKEE